MGARLIFAPVLAPVVTATLAAILLLAALSASPPVRAADVGAATGLPLPRFVSVKPGMANLRSGPGSVYPIRWVYRRRMLPLIVLDEHGHWRKVRDPWGESGWLHKSLLSGRRTALVTRDLTPLMREPASDSVALLYAERRVIAILEICEQGWCRLSIEGRAGWMSAAAIFGDENDLAPSP